MMSREELERLSNQIVEDTQREHKEIETEDFIATMKAMILKEVGEKIATHALVLIANAEKDDRTRVAQDTLKMQHTAFFIAEAAEKIMRRLWIG